MAAATEVGARRMIPPEQQLEELDPLTREIERSTGILPELAQTVSRFCNPQNVGNWYRALKRINALPRAVPALPLTVREVLHRLGDTHVLYLRPAGTLNDLIARVSMYGQRLVAEGHIQANANPFQLKFGDSWCRSRFFEAYGNVPREACWILMTKDILPESREDGVVEQEEGCRDPTADEMIVVSLFHAVATGELLYATSVSRVEEGDVQALGFIEWHRRYPIFAVGNFNTDGLLAAGTKLDYDHLRTVGELGTAAVKTDLLTQRER